MKLFTVHAEPPPPPGPPGWPEPLPRPPVLLREGFSLAAALFGPLWFARHFLWWEAAILLLLQAGALLLLPAALVVPALLATALLAGFEAHDRRAVRLARRGQPLQAVVAAPDAELALFRLAQQRPDLARGLP